MTRHENRPFVEGRRRFTCLAPGLVRLEFSPGGKFEDRRSLSAYADKKPLKFRSIARRAGELKLDTGFCTVISRENDKDFFPGNLEIRWHDSRLLQYWRPGDVDHRNLGGTIRALDMFNRRAELAGVHPADLASPDAKSGAWLAWDICEESPAYYRLSRREPWLAEIGANPHRAARLIPGKMLVRTLNRVLEQRRYCPGILSRSGYFLLNDSDSAVLDPADRLIERNTPGAKDWYFFSYGHDYKTALANFRLLSGPAPLPSKSLLGLIFSRWPAYDDREARSIVRRFQAEGYPLSALVLDMEWHKPGWCHWDWDDKMFPDPTAFIRWCHKHGVQVIMNTHPLRVEQSDSHFRGFVQAVNGRGQIEPFEYQGRRSKKIDINVCDARHARAIKERLNREAEAAGADGWWVDGARGAMNGADPLLVANKIHCESLERRGRRGLVLARYGGLGSHRYGAYFTGDTASQWEVLARQIEFNIRAGHLGLAYVSHDIGGFSHPSAPLIDPVLYVRWVQFGVFSPVLRLHSGLNSGSRQPWDYGTENRRIAAEWLSFRNSIAPYLYSMARLNYDTGLPLVRGLFLEHPEDEESYRFDEYYFGDALLVAPVVTPDEVREIYLPEGDWYDFKIGAKIAGGRTFRSDVPLDDVPLYARAGGIILRQAGPISHAGCVEDLLIDVYPGQAGHAVLYEDDGTTNRYQRGAFSRTTFTLRDDGRAIRLTGGGTPGSLRDGRRRITVEVALDAKPVSVSLNGKRLSPAACAYQPERRRAVIQLPAMPRRDTFTLESLREKRR